MAKRYENNRCPNYNVSNRKRNSAAGAKRFMSGATNPRHYIWKVVVRARPEVRRSFYYNY